MRRDTWGWRARFGILVIHKDGVPESELWAMAPPGVSIHAARFESPRRPGSDFAADAGRAVAESPDVRRGLDFLGQMQLDAICVCFGTSSFFGGYGFDEAFAAQASQLAHGTRVTTAAAAMCDAMRATGINRPMLVIPPWFTSAIDEAAERFFAAAGHPVAGLQRFDLGVGWREMQPSEIYDKGGQWEVRPEQVYHQARRAFPPEADGIVVVGSGFRSAEAIELLEHDLDVPVVTSNQAALWHCLQIARVAAPVEGFGRLFDQRLRGAGASETLALPGWSES
jgi:maleate isomerase